MDTVSKSISELINGKHYIYKSNEREHLHIQVRNSYGTVALHDGGNLFPKQ